MHDVHGAGCSTTNRESWTKKLSVSHFGFPQQEVFNKERSESMNNVVEEKQPILVKLSLVGRHSFHKFQKEISTSTSSMQEHTTIKEYPTHLNRDWAREHRKMTHSGERSRHDYAIVVRASTPQPEQPTVAHQEPRSVNFARVKHSHKTEQRSRRHTPVHSRFLASTGMVFKALSEATACRGSGLGHCGKMSTPFVAPRVACG